jgi:hypothetical protein
MVGSDHVQHGMEVGKQGRPLLIGLAYGGTFGERGVSLNSAHSVLVGTLFRVLCASCISP